MLAATDAGVFESRRGTAGWTRVGALDARVDGLWRARFSAEGVKTFAADSGGVTLWWDGSEWVRRAVGQAGKRLTGGFGRPRAAPRFVPEPIGLEVDSARSVLVFRPEDESEEKFVLAMPEQGLTVAGWAGDPREKGGLYLATIGRGLFRFVPSEPEPPVPAAREAAAGGAARQP
jgi:hypothetical protein